MRTDSIYKKLQKADQVGTTYFLDLMIFLEETEGDKFAEAVKLVSGQWGFKTSKTALFEGYAEACSLWRLGRARAFAQSTETLSSFDAEKAKVIAQQSFQVLANPDLNPKILLGFARLEVQRIRAENDSRRVAVLEATLSKAKEAVVAAREKGKGGLTKETLKQIEETLGL